jgi:hypothetical protein
MVGNAVPPRLARFLAIQIKDAFKDNEDNKLNKNDLLKNSHISIVSIAKQNKYFLIDNDNKLYNIKQNNKLLDNDNPVLISLVKSDTVSYFTKQKASIYYTGKSIPTNLDFHNVLLFFPYIKGKGIKDLYVINKIRFGTKQELHKTSKDDSLRIIFEIKFLKQFFRDYIPVHLNIWHTFTLTTMETMYKYYENEGDVIGDLY